MTPGARVQAAIGILDAIGEGAVAEKALTNWARGARYAGSKDRAAVRDHVFQALRCWRSYACLGGAETGRGRMIGALRSAQAPLETCFSGQGHAPAPLTAAEQAAGRAPVEAGDRWDLPDWLVEAFRASLGDGAETAALALRRRAPVTLRVNPRRSGRHDAVVALARDGIEAIPVPEVSSALQVKSNERKISASDAYLNGGVELQDAASQAAVGAIEVPDGARVLDYCAGGGGKALALAAGCDAAVFAHDAAPGRMADLPARAARAGTPVTILPPGAVSGAAPFDLVLCDVPCSGSGTWRRAPAAKWRLTPGALRDLTALQAKILDEAAQLAPRIAYMTCSMLGGENDAQIVRFLERHADWQLTGSCLRMVDDVGDGFYWAHLEHVQ